MEVISGVHQERCIPPKPKPRHKVVQPMPTVIERRKSKFITKLKERNGTVRSIERAVDCTVVLHGSVVDNPIGVYRAGLVVRHP